MDWYAQGLAMATDEAVLSSFDSVCRSGEHLLARAVAAGGETDLWLGMQHGKVEKLWPLRSALSRLVDVSADVLLLWIGVLVVSDQWFYLRHALADLRNRRDRPSMPSDAAAVVVDRLLVLRGAASAWSLEYDARHAGWELARVLRQDVVLRRVPSEQLHALRSVLLHQTYYPPASLCQRCAVS